MCIAIAAILAVTEPPLWPAALAIAIAGAALALALRAQGPAEYSGELAALRESNAAMRAQISETHSMIDELADVVEQLAEATMTGGVVPPTQFAALQTEIAALRNNQTGGVDEAILARVAAVEEQIAALSAKATAAPADRETPRAAVQNRSRVSLTPVFPPQLGAPTAFIVASEDRNAPTQTLLAHASAIATELDGASKDLTLFLRVSGAALEESKVFDRAFEASAPLGKRLTLLTPQAGLQQSARVTLSTLAERGCRFALEEDRKSVV